MYEYNNLNIQFRLRYCGIYNLCRSIERRKVTEAHLRRAYPISSPLLKKRWRCVSDLSCMLMNFEEPVGAACHYSTITPNHEDNISSNNSASRISAITTNIVTASAETSPFEGNLSILFQLKPAISCSLIHSRSEN